ncbi:MAG: hypothetical protein WCW13_07010 [archaeon]|jgi:hypothetical protein
MKLKIKPPTELTARKRWDEEQHWHRTWAKHALVHDIIPEHIQHYRPTLLKTFKTEGSTATERQLKRFIEQFQDYAQTGHMPVADAKGAIENLTSFVKQLNELKKRKQKARLELKRKTTKK